MEIDHKMKIVLLENIHPSALNLETAVRDGKLMQDLEPESFAMGWSFTFWECPTPLQSDSNSRSCINLPSRTAVSRLKVLKAGGFTHVEALSKTLSEQDLVDKIKDAHVVGIRSVTRLAKEILQQCPKLLAIGCFCNGTDKVDLHAARLRDIPVFNDSK